MSNEQEMREAFDAFVQELFSIMDWQGTGSMEAGERTEQAYRDRWAALRAQLVEDNAAIQAAVRERLESIAKSIEEKISWSDAPNHQDELINEVLQDCANIVRTHS